MERILSAFLAIAVFIGIVFWSGCAKEEKEIKIGVVLPLTGDGAKYGEEAQNGIDLATEEINARGGINGQKVRVIYEDDQGTSNGAVNAFNKLTSVDKVPVVIGPMYSSTTLAVAPVAEDSKVVLFTPSGSSPEITEAGDYIFRNWPSDIFEGGEMAKFAYENLGIRKSSILTVNLDYGIGLTEVFKTKFTEWGGEILAVEKYDQGATDFRTQLSKIKAAKPDALYLPGYYTEIALILRQAKELGFDAHFLSCVGFDNPKVFELAGEAAEGVIFARPAYDPESEEKTVSDFVESFKAKYNITPGTYAAHAYDALRIVAKAIEEGGYSANQVKSALYSIKSFSGVTGNTSFDGNGDVVKPIQIMEVQNGQFRER